MPFIHPFRVQLQRLQDRLQRCDVARDGRPSAFARLTDFLVGLPQRLAVLRGPFIALHRRLSARIDQAADATAPRTPSAQQSVQRTRRFYDPILLAFRVYADTRNSAQLRRGVPAMFVILAGIFVTCIITGLFSSAKRHSDLLAEAHTAMGRKDYPTAQIAFERLLQTGNDEPAIRFDLATCLASIAVASHDSVQFDRAEQILKALAPDDPAVTGYAPAHRALAMILMETPNATPDDLHQAQSHLESLLAANPDNADAHSLLGALLQRLNRPEEARAHFLQAAAIEPILSLNAAMLAQQTNDNAAAQRFASDSVAHLRSQIDALPDAQPVPAQLIIGLAQALCIQQKYSDAIAAIENNLHRTPAEDHDRLVAAILQIAEGWQKILDAAGTHDRSQDLPRLQIARSILAYRPTDRPAQLHLLDLVSAKSAVQDSASALLRDLARPNDAAKPQETPAIAEVCFYLGMDAFAQNDLARARDCLLQSWSKQPDHPATANNLACAYLESATDAPADPAAALPFASAAVSADPHNPYYLETRGQAYLALNQPEAAAKDLEAALTAAPGDHDTREAHLMLASAYQALKQPDKAREHQLAAGNH